jgi:DNA-binding NarL/FixJ family response regulator
MIRVVVADDQGMLRSALRLLLDDEDDITVGAEAADGLAALEAIRTHRPDVALVDIRMPELDGIAVTRTLVGEGAPTRILVLTTFDLDEYVFDALRAGASAFVLKDAPAEELLRAVRSVGRGDAVLDPAVTRRVIERVARLPASDPIRPPAAALGDLSPRELEVLTLVAAGLSNAEVAVRLVVSEATVKSHVSSILAKLRARDRVQLVIAAYETGLVRPGAASP